MDTIQHRDTERMADLLGEYADKLRSLLRERRKIENRVLIMIFLMIFIISSATLIILSNDYQIFNSELSQISTYLISLLAGLFISIFIHIYIKVLPFYFTQSSFYTGDGKDIYNEIYISANKLSKVVRYASQALEHTEMSRSEQLEMELHLADAESALDRARRVVGDEALSSRHSPSPDGS